MKTDATVLGCLTIPGKPQHVAAARAFTARTLGNCDCADTAVLLTCELVTNSLQHSDSRHEGGNITVILIAVPGGIRAEVIDEGGTTVPALRRDCGSSPDLAEGGRGLQLVELLAARWDYCRDEAGTVTWFELTDPPA